MKVYCGYCQYYPRGWANKSECNFNVKYVDNDTPRYPNKMRVSVSLDTKNKNNDCQDFKKYKNFILRWCNR